MRQHAPIVRFVLGLDPLKPLRLARIRAPRTLSAKAMPRRRYARRTPVRPGPQHVWLGSTATAGWSRRTRRRRRPRSSPPAAARVGRCAATTRSNGTCTGTSLGGSGMSLANLDPQVVQLVRARPGRSRLARPADRISKPCASTCGAACAKRRRIERGQVELSTSICACLRRSRGWPGSRPAARHVFAAPLAERSGSNGRRLDHQVDTAAADALLQEVGIDHDHDAGICADRVVPACWCVLARKPTTRPSRSATQRCCLTVRWARCRRRS